MIRVLVVDDDFRVSGIHAAFVAKLSGFRVVGQAHTAADALRATTESQPDLVLMDIYLPDGNGIDVVRDLLNAAQPPDVFMITAARDIASVRAAMKLGAVGYLVKPFGFSAFAARLEAYRDLRDRVEAYADDAEADQSQVDALFRVSGGSDMPSRLPKGHSAPTLDLVRGALQDSGSDMSAAQVAEKTGVSRPTAQRYLVLLVKQGVAKLELRYGATGRPEHRYVLTR